jgi:hypothetical protein
LRGKRAVRQQQLVGIRRIHLVLHGGVRMGTQRWDVHGNLRRRDAQGGREVRRREHASGYMWRGAGMRGACRQLRGRMQSRPTDDLLVERVRQWQPCGRGTDAAHHARSSAAGNVQGGKQTADVCFSAGCGDQMLGGEEECRSQAVRSSGSWFSRFSRLMEVAVEGRRHR